MNRNHFQSKPQTLMYTICVFFAFTFLHLSANADSIPIEIEAAITKNAEQLNGLEFEIKSSFKALRYKSELPSQLHFINERDFLKTKYYYVRIDGNRFYKKVDFGNNFSEITFDGTKKYFGRPPSSSTASDSLLTISSQKTNLDKDKIDKWRSEHFYWVYFDNAGFRLPEYAYELGSKVVPLAIHWANLGEVVSVEDNGIVQIVVRALDPWIIPMMNPKEIDHAVSQLRGDSKEIQRKILEEAVKFSKSGRKLNFRFFLDPELGYAVVENRIETLSGELIAHTKCSDFIQVEERPLWLPRKCNTEFYANDNHPNYVSKKPMYRQTNQLISVKGRYFSDSDFAVWYDNPGGTVFDYTAAGATSKMPISYRVPGSIENLRKSSGGNRTVFWVTVNLLSLACIALFIWSRRASG